jgi:hypothetical protein
MKIVASFKNSSYGRPPPDHGTDLATEVDDMPVNMPAHAHGQGYSDFNFLIPELVSDLHFKKSVPLTARAYFQYILGR